MVSVLKQKKLSHKVLIKLIASKYALSLRVVERVWAP